MRTAFLLLALSAAACAQTSSGPWELEPSGSSAGLRGIYNVGGGVVWASGTGGVILRSEDTGYLWQQCAVPPDGARLDFRGVWARDAQTVWAMSSGPGDKSRLYQSTDGCSSWKLIFANTDPAGFWDGFRFLDRTHGLLYGDSVKDSTGHPVLPIFATKDGGVSWQLDPGSPAAKPAESAFAASNSSLAAQPGRLWLGTSHSRVLYKEGNLGWTGVATPLASGNDSSGVFSVAFRDRKHGVAVGGDYQKPAESKGTAAYTSDGGLHWSAARRLPHGYRSAVAWDEQDHAWITAGSNGSDISYDDGATWQWLDGGNWNALSLPWAVGPNGQIGKLGRLPGVQRTAGSGVSR
jgi:photosystem II stability/assembly factor-like uncharacterized protein